MIVLDTYDEEGTMFATKLTINGEVIDRSEVRYIVGRKMSVKVKDESGSRKIIEGSFNEIKSYVGDISLALSAGPQELTRTVLVAHVDRRGNIVDAVIASINPILANWSKPWSFFQYLSVFQDEVRARNARGYRLISPDVSNALRLPSYENVSAENFNRDLPLTTIINDLSLFIQEVHEATERQLTANLSLNSLVTFFDFPPTVRVACEQYLQYFIQFLDDLGIKADSEISSDAGRVLFSVTPRSGVEALEAIQEALTVYLALPTENLMTGGELMGGDIALMQLRANISHLQGQLAIAHGIAQLGQATIQAKDATINAQATEIAMYQRHQMVRTNDPDLIRLEQSASVSRQDAEPLFGSVVKVVPLKVKGFEVDLPHLLRRLKRRFSGNDE